MIHKVRDEKGLWEIHEVGKFLAFYLNGQLVTVVKRNEQ